MRGLRENDGAAHAPQRGEDAMNASRHVWSVIRRALACALLGLPAAAFAAYPDHPIRLVMPSPPGGGTDTAWRMITPKLGEVLGQQIVVDNRGGASGNIGAEIAARAAPDGYTVLACIASHTINPLIMKKVPYDLFRDFAPVSLAVMVPNILVTNPSLPTRDMRSLIAFVKAHPGELQFASAGQGSMPHLMMQLFVSMAGLKMVHVPYKGAGPAVVDVIAGHVPMVASNILTTLPHVRAGKLRAYGVTTATRSPAAPDIPAIAETLPGYEAAQWFGLLAPAGTPQDVVTKLHAAVVRAVNDPELKQRFVREGAVPAPSATPEAFREFMQAETGKWAKVVKAAGMRPD
jgi:tripartite-type tricarboxylate transporter receptor subunit TctC